MPHFCLVGVLLVMIATGHTMIKEHIILTAVALYNLGSTYVGLGASVCDIIRSSPSQQQLGAAPVAVRLSTALNSA